MFQEERKGKVILKHLKKISAVLAAMFVFVSCAAPASPEENKQQPESTSTPVISTEAEAPAEEPAETPVETPTEPPAAPTETPTTNPSTPAAPVVTTPAEMPVVEETPADSTFSIQFVDVGQADAALVECDGHYMLIDGGNKGDSNVIYSVLNANNVSNLDIVVGTHAHEDHIGGLPGAYNYASVDLTLCPVTSFDSEAFTDFKNAAGTLTVPSVGDTYELGSADVTILGVNGGSDTNDTSIILKIIYGETSFIFTGDAEYAAEQAVLNRGANLSANVLKIGHHGSDTSTSYQFLREIMPEYAIISVGKDNGYGHPTDTVLSRLRDADVKVYRTDLNGDVYVTSDGKTVSVSSDKAASDSALLTPGSTSSSSSGNSGSSSASSNSNQSSTSAPSTPAVTPTPVPSTPAATEKPKEEPSAPASVGQSYVLNTNSKKFHYPDCSSVKKMSAKNRQDVTATRDSLISQGYDPCGNCHP